MTRKPLSLDLEVRWRLPDARAGLFGLAALTFLFIVLPIVAIFLRAIASASSIEVLNSRPVLDAVALSLGTTAVSTLAILLFGTPLSYVLARFQFPFKRVVNTLVELPIILPPVVAGFGLLVAFGRRGLLGPWLEEAGISLPFTTAAVVLAQIFVAAPFFIRTAQVRFAGVPRELEEMARINGAGTWDFFRRIALPLSAPGLLAGLVLSWARALGEFGATILFAGSLQGRTQTMPLFVYSTLERSLDSALWTSVILISVATTALFLGRWLARRFEEEADILI